MSKRKATSDIHPDARDERPGSSRFKIEESDFNSLFPNMTKLPGIAAKTSLTAGNSKTLGLSICEIQVESFDPIVPKGDQLKQNNTDNAVATGTAKEEAGGGSQWDCDPTTMRSRHFLENIAELNRSFAAWINSSVKEDPTALLTRVFIDHQRQVQALIDEEREHTVDLDKLLVLRAQEKVLQLLKEADEDDDSTSSSCSVDSSKDETQLINGAVSAEETCSITTTASNVSSPNVPQKLTFNPFLVNNAINGTKPTTSPNKPTEQITDVVKDPEPKPVMAVADKPVNFATLSFASACKAAATAAAAAREQTSEEQDEDTPPKVEFTPVQEEGAVYTKRCKIFFKKEKEDGYEDRGIGNLFVKPVPSINRHQLIVRSETALGNLLVNVLLSPDIVIKKMGDKNVMLIMVPLPGSTIRVVMVRMKDGADEVADMLTKFSTT